MRNLLKLGEHRLPNDRAANRVNVSIDVERALPVILSMFQKMVAIRLHFSGTLLTGLNVQHAHHIHPVTATLPLHLRGIDRVNQIPDRAAHSVVVCS